MRDDRTRAVCFARMLSYPGAGNAGAGLLQSYLELTEPWINRVVVAPLADRNVAALPFVSTPVHLVRPSQDSERPDVRLANYLGKDVLSGFASHYLQLGCYRDSTLRAQLASAEIVEYHWEDMANLMPWGRTVAPPSARHVVFFHDVVSQRLTRSAETLSRSWQRQVFFRAAAVHRRREAQLCRAADAVLVLSEKDADLLPSDANVIVARPPVRVDGTANKKLAVLSAPIFVFVAALNRLENVEAVEWLLDGIWPLIQAAIPGAELRLVGAGASERLTAHARAVSGCVVTGYVDDLRDEYAHASVALVPLRNGAGVKLKTLEAMVTGTPAVVSSVGAEGIDQAPAFLLIEDDTVSFANAAIDAATHGASAAAERAVAAQQWVAEAHGVDQFRRAVLLACDIDAEVPTIFAQSRK